MDYLFQGKLFQNNEKKKYTFNWNNAEKVSSNLLLFFSFWKHLALFFIGTSYLLHLSSQNIPLVGDGFQDIHYDKDCKDL